MSENMKHNASIDAAYEVVEQIERQKRRLTLTVIGISISALLGLVVNAFAVMVFTHQKGPSDNNNIILIGTIFLICLILLGLAIKKLIILNKFKQRLNPIGELEETIYNEVLKLHLE
jgi:ABC-type enterobactin transport system permease subunit